MRRSKRNARSGTGPSRNTLEVTIGLGGRYLREPDELVDDEHPEVLLGKGVVRTGKAPPDHQLVDEHLQYRLCVEGVSRIRTRMAFRLVGKAVSLPGERQTKLLARIDRDRFELAGSSAAQEPLSFPLGHQAGVGVDLTDGVVTTGHELDTVENRVAIKDQRGVEGCFIAGGRGVDSVWIRKHR